MPELPEVEAARRALEEHCIGKKINKCTVADDPNVIIGVSSKDFEAALVGKTIVSARRKGKNMWLELDSPPFPSFQFGMAGAVYIKGVAVTNYKRSAVKDTDEWPSKYSKLFVELADGLEFSFTDKRRFAKVRLLDNPVSVPPISELGPDALMNPMTEDEFYNSLNKKRIGIKTLLLDQSFISGIGNWMADEVLYQARIHPLQTASSMSKESCATLLKCINEVTNFAVEVKADSLRFPVEWLFHYRWGKKPGKVNGKQIEFIYAGGRTSAFVPELQMLSGNQAVKETGKRSKGKTAGKGGSPEKAKAVKGKKSGASVEASDDEKDGADDGSPSPKRKGGAKNHQAVKETGKRSKGKTAGKGGRVEEDRPEKAKAVKGKKTSCARKPSSKKKSGASVESSDDEKDGNGADDGSPSPKRKGGAKNPPAKGKSKGGKKDEKAETRKLEAKVVLQRESRREEEMKSVKMRMENR